MSHLLAADYVRFGGRRDLRLLVALVPVILAVMFISEFNGIATPPRADFFIEPPDPVMEAQLQEQMLADWRGQLDRELPAFAFPASLIKVAGNIGPLVFLAIYLSVALVAGEFEWGTVRTLHLTSRRGATLAVRIGVVTGLIAVATAIGLVVASIIPFLLSVEGRPLQDRAGPVPGLIADVGIRMLAVVPFITIPALLAVLGRSTGLAFVFTLLFLVGDLAVTGAPIWETSPVPWLPALTLTGSISRLFAGDATPLAAVAPAWLSVLALLAWAILPAVAAIARFRRLDINE
ncbi:MAG: hypothetical protein ABI562_08700 [Chloroflexota bacterium]